MKNTAKKHKFFSYLREIIIMVSFFVSINLFAYIYAFNQKSILKIVLASFVLIMTLVLVAIHYSIEGKDISSFFED
ncbi:hypothetical protein [Apilactobacillus apinorum]|uniref:Uncharacterized protein n=1 Tax=Apilactobacillus apinorum TaxID=1218495 RepID=A0ABP9ZHN6_9LACO|nr:hypothetical protein [Apilactobacillus apinorum]